LWRLELFRHPGVRLGDRFHALRDRFLVISMDRLLHYFLDHFIRRGAMTFTTASGARFTCGDGTGEPVAAFSPLTPSGGSCSTLN
jgi:hypothetical protein